MNDLSFIKLNGKRGGFAVVDSEDFERLNARKWRINRRGYVAHTINNSRRFTIILLHREVLNLPRSQGYEDMVDHRNGIKTDNRRTNIRPCNRIQNSANRPAPANNTSGFKGVVLDKRSGKWYAQIRFNQLHIHIGSFRTKQIAALAYDQKARELFGDFANFNFK